MQTNTAIEEHKGERVYTFGIGSFQVIPPAGFLLVYAVKINQHRPRALLLWHQDSEEKKAPYMSVKILHHPGDIGSPRVAS